METFETKSFSGKTLTHQIQKSGKMNGLISCTGPLMHLKRLIKSNANQEFKLVPAWKEEGQQIWAAIPLD